MNQSVQTGSVESDGTGDTAEIKVDRPAEEYARKLVEVSAESKKFRQKASSLVGELEKTQAELNKLREEKLKEQGQWKTMYEDLKSKYDLESEARKKDRAAFAFKTVTSQFAAEASKTGCARVEDLIKLASADGILNDLEVSSEDFSVSPDSLKSVVEKAQKAYPYLYAKPTPNVRDGIPSQNKSATLSKEDFSSMKMEDLIKLAKQVN
jgi:predicted nuclease with TOPRIM domain